MRVSRNACAFAEYLQLPDIHHVSLLSELHDIGKLDIPTDLLNKQTPLTEEEFNFIKQHTMFGSNRIKSISELSPHANVILYHHENINGTGYFGLKSKEIPLLSRMIRILDTYDTMLYGRHYQKPFKEFEVFQELKRLAGIYYDKELVELFIYYHHTKR